jgi:hypothetical protein
VRHRPRGGGIERGEHGLAADGDGTEQPGDCGRDHARNGARHPDENEQGWEPPPEATGPVFPHPRTEERRADAMELQRREHHPEAGSVHARRGPQSPRGQKQSPDQRAPEDAPLRMKQLEVDEGAARHG